MNRVGETGEILDVEPAAAVGLIGLSWVVGDDLRRHGVTRVQGDRLGLSGRKDKPQVRVLLLQDFGKRYKRSTCISKTLTRNDTISSTFSLIMAGYVRTWRKMTVPVCLETASTILTDCIALSSGMMGI